MAPYYLIIIQNYTIPAIYSYDDYDALMVRFHTELAYRHEDRTSTVCIVLDNKGNEMRRDWYEKPEEEVTENA